MLIISLLAVGMMLVLSMMFIPLLPTPKRMIVSFVLGFIFVILMIIPFVSLPFVVLAWPLVNVFPLLGKTGAHVEIVFLSVIPKSVVAWLAFTTYFSFLWFVILSFLYYIAPKER